MKDPVAVTMRDALAQLKEETLYEGRRKGSGVGGLAIRIDELLEICVEVLKYEVEEGFAGLAVNVLDAEKADHVKGLGQHLKQRHLSEGGGRNALLVHL